VATCEKLKAAGITPLVFGNKGGLASEVIFDLWTIQPFDSGEEMKKVVSKEGTWVHPELVRFLHMYKELYDKGYFQEGGMGYTFEETFSNALVGDNAAIGIYHGLPAYAALRDARGEDVAAMAATPIWAQGKLNDAVPIDNEVVGIAPWTKHLDEAVTVLKEFLSPEWQTRLLLEADMIPTSPDVDPGLIKDPHIQDLVARMQNNSSTCWYGLYSHPEWQAQVRYLSLFLLGDVTAEEALAQMDAAKGEI